MPSMTAQREIPLAEAVRRIREATGRSKPQAHIDMRSMEPTAVYGPTKMYGEDDVAALIESIMHGGGAE